LRQISDYYLYRHMIPSRISDLFVQSLPLQKLQESIAANEREIELSGLVGSALSLVLAKVASAQNRPMMCVMNDKESAAYLLNDLENILGEEDVLFYPGSYRRPYQIEETDNANVLLRSEVLTRLSSRKKPAFVVTYPEALFEKVVTKKTLEQHTLKLKVGDQLDVDFVNEVLFDYQFTRTDFVTEPGEFSVRGGILDVFSFSSDTPYRIEFFEDSVESIRSFDVASQRSLTLLKKITIIPNVSQKATATERHSFLAFSASKTLVVVQDRALTLDAIDKLFQKATSYYSALEGPLSWGSPKELFCTRTDFAQELTGFQTIFLAHRAPSDRSIEFRTRPQPAFQKQFPLLIEHLNANHDDGIETVICCSSAAQAKRFHDIFEDAQQDIKQYTTIIFPLHRGFIDLDQRVACYTDHQIFERYHKFHLKNGYAKKQAITLKELTQLQQGDYVTHIDHGIGTFGGLKQIEVNGRSQEAIKLIYGDRDILYLSIHALHKIAKFNGKDGVAPKLHKLGSAAWKTLKQKTKARVKEIAFNLIELYAKRRLHEGFAYGPDSYLQHELESSFMYEDTPDQTTATQDIKNDMESDRAMDRLVCGDVGFGKTEVAIRAAFKAVDNGKQVAILVPTTILAFQHFKTFTARLANMPVTVDYLNRFRTAKERKHVLESLKSGQLDIVIGTHQLVNPSVSFKDLGLLIVDEEQKFGVAVKDKLKTLKASVDTLTLTATPIPRTLQFSLMAARDLSVINTAPPNRYPVDTQVVRFSESIIRDAVMYEISRGGQVFFVHNRIENIREVAGMIQRLVPEAKIGIGHGQMDGKKLETLMFSFMNNEFDVLVSTTIIESGLDVPNANTILIHNAHNFGLSDLHQMRGRVGRSNKKAFCYFITPPYSSMTDEARKRMTALEQFSDLGSGIHIAMKDLEIRGAGDLLGGEQSGFINEIGFDTYQKILAEAIDELKEKEFKSLYAGTQHEKKDFIKETVIDSDFELRFPDDYINSVSERLTLYTDLGGLKTEAEFESFEQGLVDRFGALPKQAIDLMHCTRLKILATSLGLERVVLKNNRLVGYFISDQESAFYQSNLFGSILEFVQIQQGPYKLKQKETRNGLRLLLTIEGIKSVREGLEQLRQVNAPKSQ
jgi:transcription-repair coupling factor (superfamily II helicase)